ncbi:MAG TPA: hypothetical protein VIX82_18630 [Solirubrobacteraceae bacterium]
MAPTFAVGLEATSEVEVEPGPTTTLLALADPATVDALSGVNTAETRTGDEVAGNDVWQVATALDGVIVLVAHPAIGKKPPDKNVIVPSGEPADGLKDANKVTLWLVETGDGGETTSVTEGVCVIVCCEEMLAAGSVAVNVTGPAVLELLNVAV